MNRLTSAMLASALLRRAQQEGGFGAVLAKGDETAGAIILLIAERGTTMRVLERVLNADGNYAWGDALAAAPNESELKKFLERRRRFDPDMWVLELDIASAERFAAELTGFD